jgi:hypothetical protein
MSQRRRPSMARLPAAASSHFSLPSLSLSLFKVEPELPHSPLHSHCKHTRLSIPFTRAAASASRRRWKKLTAGEGFSFPPLFSLSCVAPVAHRTSFAPGSCPCRFGGVAPLSAGVPPELAAATELHRLCVPVVHLLGCSFTAG